MKNSLVHALKVKKCSSKIPLAPELLSILDLPTDGVLWRKNEQEYILFNKEKWGKFVKDMKASLGLSPGKFQYSRQGCDFLRKFYSEALSVDIDMNGIHLPSRSIMKKHIQGKNILIQRCL